MYNDTDRDFAQKVIEECNDSGLKVSSCAIPERTNTDKENICIASRTRSKTAIMKISTDVGIPAVSNHSSQSHRPKDSRRVERSNSVQEKSHSRTRHQQEAVVLPILTEDKDSCAHNDTEVQRELCSTSSVVGVNGETETTNVGKDTTIQKKIVFMKPNEVSRILSNAVLGRGPLIEAIGSDNADNNSFKLPLKFRFEDEVPNVVEETAFEEEMDELMNDFDMALEMRSQQESPRSTPHVSTIN